MNKKKKIKELEDKVFEMEARLELMEFHLNRLIASQGMSTTLDSDKWYSE